MTQPEIATAYEAANKIIVEARCKSADLDVIWQKLKRISQYVDTTATSLLSETLS